jgi:hypothetical protein
MVTIDNVFCQELFYPPDAPKRFPFPQYSLMSWGVCAEALRLNV